ncbi:hypothetical protein ERICI_00771 [Paenibacillus larvae subsp. larvae]|uniref:Uncharacterized protein n=2 Tax=Paenibacillus larvae subsp. larvae TaxID=147375 RepID=V9WBQ0_9BACL|nr:hypothetical protein ERIC2_c34090 [Paenibacillus larvae subsp. larvae DSM 25430]AQT85845.1 hypothetical protein B1222_17770 [Paenibacillus larvae subsp. pulvifaciens]AVF20684.1 hypothetical protein ERICI_00771 [Paenibacillus larvae subsp. larvae]ETK28351.1 hypothetical protein ERIC1_1c18130 [Paenibacillus larvae subsp. larvae DSM 25719]MBH0344560.1 hypothetical protein [Paenibacillus larvae]
MKLIQTFFEPLMTKVARFSGTERTFTTYQSALKPPNELGQYIPYSDIIKSCWRGTKTRKQYDLNFKKMIVPREKESAI